MKSLLPLFVGLFLTVACGANRLEETGHEALNPIPVQNPIPSEAWVFPASDAPGSDGVLTKYSSVDPGHQVPDKLLKAALLFFDANLNRITNQNYLSVVDYSKHSSKNRYWLINMKSGAVTALHVSHGKNSDPNDTGYATKFGNVIGSEKSSLGFYQTGASFVWSGHGHGVNLYGLSSTNSNAATRGIYFHGSSYVFDRDVQQGRSLGCLATSLATDAKLYPLIEDGSIIYVDLSGVR